MKRAAILAAALAMAGGWAELTDTRAFPNGYAPSRGGRSSAGKTHKKKTRAKTAAKSRREQRR